MLLPMEACVVMVKNYWRVKRNKLVMTARWDEKNKLLCTWLHECWGYPFMQSLIALPAAPEPDFCYHILPWTKVSMPKIAITLFLSQASTAQTRVASPGPVIAIWVFLTKTAKG